MAYDEKLAARVRGVLEGKMGDGKMSVREQKMFGGLVFMLHGNMACGIHGTELIVRVGRDNFDNALSLPHARPFDLTGRPMRGFVFVSPQGIAADSALSTWIARGITHAQSLPPK